MIRLHCQLWLGLGLIGSLGSSAFAQTAFPEAEPNGRKPEATSASCMRSGDFLTGLTTGTSTTAANSADTSADYFRVQTCAAPQGIYRHTLTITTVGAAGHSGTIRGLNQTGTLDSTAQTSSSTTTPARSNTWYGFGKGEELYYKITGSLTTTGAYSVTLSSTQVAPVAIAGTFLAATPITITTVGQGHSTDTDFWVYDANLDAIPTNGNDDEFAGTTLQSRLTRTYTAGTYFIAMTTFDLASNQVAAADDDFLAGGRLDFPNVVLNNNVLSTSTLLDFSVSDGTTTTPVVISRASPFEIVWAQFTVGAPTAPQAYCFGDGTGTVCPCSPVPVPNGASGNGCPNSLFLGGANLAATGTASISADTMTLVGTDMPNSSALYFQGTTQVAGGLGGVFGDGLRCAGGSIARLGTKVNSLNSSSYGFASGDTPVSVRGGVANGGRVRTYQIWYRNPDPSFCTASTFNLTNGLRVLWTP